MKNQPKNLNLFRAITGKTIIVPKETNKNPYGYQISRVTKIRKFGGI